MTNKEIKKLSITLEKDVYDRLSEYCKDKTSKSIFLRRLIKKALGIEKNTDKEKKIIKIEVDNYNELKEYVEAKKFGSIKSFATYSMAQAMTRHPLPSSRKNIQNSENDKIG